MYEENQILSRIEKLVDKLPYRFVKIEIELESKTVTLTKEKQCKIGFFTKE